MSHHKILFYINKLSLRAVVLIFFTVISVFAITYWTLGRLVNQGIAPTYNNGAVADIWDYFYFSIVTITSLGYGDYRPVDISKAFAALEVILGFGIFGIFVSKISSAKQEFFLRRLYSSDVQNRLKQYRVDYRGFLADYRELNELLLNLFNKERGLENIPADLKFRLEMHSFKVWNITRSLKSYLSFEIRHGELFEDVPNRAIKELIEFFDSIIELWEEIDISLLGSYVSAYKAGMVKKVFRRFKDVCDLVIDHGHNQELVDYAQRISGKCQHMLKKLSGSDQANGL